MLFTVRCSTETARALAQRVKAEREAEGAWWAERYRAIPERAGAAQRAELLDAAQAEFERLRAAGQFRGTRAALLVPALRAELDERGWLTRRWRLLPEGARSRRGRRWGTPDRQWPARFTVELPDDLGELLVRATYWTSAPAVRRLQAWYDQHGDGVRGLAHGGRRWLGSGPSPTDFARREALRAEIVTTSDVLRAAARRVLGSPAAAPH